MATAETTATRRPTRRNFIVWAMTGILGSFAAAILAPILVYVWPAPRPGQKNEEVTAGLDKSLDSLQNGDAAKFQAPTNKAFILKTGGGQNAAGDLAFAGYAVKEQSGKINVFATTCPHLGCSVALNKDAKRFDCPCHGSQFALNGDVIHGPATAPLAELTWKKGSNPNQIQVYGITLGQGG